MDWYDITGNYHEQTLSQEGRLTSLPEEWQRELAAIWRLEADVNNGAYLQFLANWGRDTYVYARQALNKIGAHKMATIVDHCQALVVAETLPEPNTETDQVEDTGTELQQSARVQRSATFDELTTTKLRTQAIRIAQSEDGPQILMGVAEGLPMIAFSDDGKVPDFTIMRQEGTTQLSFCRDAEANALTIGNSSKDVFLRIFDTKGRVRILAGVSKGDEGELPIFTILDEKGNPVQALY